MKKLLVLSLLTVFAHVRSTVVQLTEEEKILRDKIINYEFHDEFNKTLKASLSFNCGIGSTNPADEYDSDKNPKCRRMLEFLAVYAQATENMRREILKFTETRK